MKRFFACLILLLCLSSLLLACGDGEEGEPTIVGVWKSEELASSDSQVPTDTVSQRMIYAFAENGHMLSIDLYADEITRVIGAHYALDEKGILTIRQFGQEDGEMIAELSGKTLGVIGLGAIGVLVANAAKSLGMKVYGYDPFLSLQNAWNLSHSIMRAETLDEIYERCDYISLHLPLNKDTRGTVGKEAISKMKSGVRILNFARDGIVDSEAMLSALESKKVACYVVDFPTDEMLGVENVIAIPHLGASTPESEDNCAVMAAREVREYLEDGNITNSINFPNVSMPRSGKHRICVIHRNIPSMISSVTSVLSKDSVNIENLINKSRDSLAYTMLDVCECNISLTLSHISKIEGVIRVRAI